MEFSFSKKYRLKRKREFEAVYKEGKKKNGKFVVIYYLENELGYPRLGLSVSKKIGKAVTRNRWKRLIREIFRLNKHLFPSWDIVIAVKRGYKPPKYRELEEDIVRTIVGEQVAEDKSSDM
ncbi:MAG: ribonuclease P protein component [Thermosulfidibacteraceae bacterium]|jgi:ribonuclease P protein component